MTRFFQLGLLGAAVVLCVVAFSVPLRIEAASVTYELRLTGAEENPAVTNDPASATAVFVFDDASRTLDWSLTISGVAPELITGAHIHRGAVGVNGPIIYPLTTDGWPTSTGKVSLTDADVSDLMAGNLYVNIHTAAHPGGAARAQLVAPLARLHQEQINALNAGDLSATMSFFADNAQITVGGCSPTPCVGKAAIQNEVQAQITNHAYVTILNPSVSGNTLTETEDIAYDPFLAVGISRVRFIFTTVYSGNKVISAAGVPDFSDPMTIAFLHSQSQPSVQPPNTGDAGLAR